MDSLHYSSDPQLLEQPHTTRASELFFLKCANEPNPFFRSWTLYDQYAGWVVHYYPKHQLSLVYYHRPLTLQLLPGSNL